jgi:glutamyl-tRNA synthetase
MTAAVRFAPSPTGRLHIGNARTALLNWLFGHALGGQCVLRFDDTDAERSSRELEVGIREDLAWLGLHWDVCIRQSERLAHYEDALERLRQAGVIYACFETKEELECKRALQLARGRPPVYDRAALAMTGRERAAAQAEGRRAHWRLKLPDAEVGWQDMVRGPVRIHTSSLSDPVVVREDGSFLYMLPSAVDDIALAITHVIRGEDHVVNTAVQIVLHRELGAETPAYAHIPLLSDSQGRNLSKRLGSLTLQALRDEGIEALALAAYLARLGTARPIEPAPDLNSLAEAFDIAHLARATPKLDRKQLDDVNARFVRGLCYESARQRLSEMGLHRAGADFWFAVRENLDRFHDVRYWYDVCFGHIDPVVADAAVASQAAALLPPEPWNKDTWPQWTAALGERTGRRGKDLFRPLRLALTGRTAGPEMKALLPLIGRELAARRLIPCERQ